MRKIIACKINEVTMQISADSSICYDLRDYFKFRPPGFQFVPAYRNKLWDGYIKLYDLRESTLPIGLLSYLKQFCKERDCILETSENIEYIGKIDNNKLKMFIDSLKLPFPIRDYQYSAVKYFIEHQRSVLLSPTGSGKSLCLYTLTRYYNEKSLLIVPNLSLISQMRSDFLEYAINDNTFTDDDIHLIYQGQEKDSDKKLFISTWQSIYKIKQEWFDQFKFVMVDECHQAKSESFDKILKKLKNTPIRCGTTGTLSECKVDKLVIEGLIGPAFEVTKTEKLMKDKKLAQLKINCVILKYNDLTRKLLKDTNYNEQVDYIISNKQRTGFIVNLSHSLKGNTLVLFDRVESHGKLMYELHKKKFPNDDCYLITGDVKPEERENVRKLIENKTNAVIFATSSIFSTGINIKNLENVVFAFPSKSKIKTLQSIGRILRIGRSDKATLYDIVDDFSYKSKKCHSLKHFLHRIKLYDKEKFEYKTILLDF